jgi:hypothetical protein
VWEQFTIQGTTEIEKLRYSLTDYQYNEGDIGRLPDLLSEQASAFVIFSAHPDENLYAQCESVRQKGNIPEIASPVAGYANNWQIEQADSEIIFRRV